MALRRQRPSRSTIRGSRWWLLLPLSLFGSVLSLQVYRSFPSVELASSIQNLLSLSGKTFEEQQQPHHQSTTQHAHPLLSFPEKKLFYGHVLPAGGATQQKIRAPFIVLPRKLGQQMLDYFRNLAFFQLDLRQLEGDETTGFVACVDHPEIVNHHYWEGCFHARADVSKALSDIFHPRHQRAFTMPVAPLELRALMECLRQRLTKVWYEPLVRSRLIALAGKSSSDLKTGFETLVEILDNGGMFSSLAVQVHYGDAITRHHLHWHTDWANSLLHLGMGVGKGRRGLHRKCTLTADASEEAQDMVEWQEPGDAYVSSPKFFDHGVEFPQIDEWEDRVIAVQSRMLFSPEQHQSLLTSRLNENEAFVMLWTQMMDALNEVLIELPSVHEVEAMALRIAETKGDEKLIEA